MKKFNNPSVEVIEFAKNDIATADPSWGGGTAGGIEVLPPVIK